MTTTDRQQHTQLLLLAGRLLLEYNESTRGIVEALKSTAAALTDAPCHVAVSYGQIAVSLGDDAPLLRTVKELRLNAAVQTRTHDVLQQLQAGRVDVETALERLNQLEVDTPKHPRWLVALLLGIAGSSFARLLGGDAAAAVVVGIATALGLLVRQELGRRHASLLALPLSAACLGALLGGIAIRLGWTGTPEVAIVVPAIMIVPGPHILNGLLDLVDNFLPMSLARLGLATGILLASALGIVLGVRLMLPSVDFSQQAPRSAELNFVSDALLAGIAACGFAAFFNTPWRSMGLAALGGMAGHGLRFLALEEGLALDVATFLGGLVVGALSAGMARMTRAPVAVLAFAGAVTMIPGSSFYRALGGMLRLARLGDSENSHLVPHTLSHAFEGLVVAGALAVGLLMGIRGTQWLFQVGER